jgi:hypothetical protein
MPRTSHRPVNEWRNRVENWKFRSAYELMSHGHPRKDEVGALADLFEDCGWFDGHMGTIVALAVTMVLDERRED